MCTASDAYAAACPAHTLSLETYDENGKQISTQNIKIPPVTGRRFYTSVLQPAGTTRTYK